MALRGVALGKSDTRGSRKHNPKAPDFSTIFAVDCLIDLAVVGLRLIALLPNLNKQNDSNSPTVRRSFTVICRDSKRGGANLARQ